MSELKPCPFCGGENVETSYKDTFSGDFRRGVYCADCCGGIYPYYNTEAEAIAAWNTRHQCGLTDEDYSILLDELGVSERTCEYIGETLAAVVQNAVDG